MPANPSFIDWAISTYAPTLVPANFLYGGLQRLSDILNYEAQSQTYDPSLAVPVIPTPDMQQLYQDINGYPASFYYSPEMLPVPSHTPSYAPIVPDEPSMR